MKSKMGSGSKMSKLWAFIGAIICIFMLQTSAMSNALGVPDAEYNALVTLYNNLGGSSWTNHTNWLTENTPWHGVTIGNGHVTSINLFGNRLKGPIPTEIGNLTNLQTLDLGCNPLSGAIPAEIGNLTNLQTLDLYNNHLSGALPAEIGNLTNLQTLDLHNNQLSGAIPAEIGNLTSLQTLDLSYNQLIGDIPASITNMTSLTSIRLDYNALLSTNPAVLSFLDSRESYWQSTQTVPPINVSAAITSSKTANVSWTPIGNFGYFEIGYSSTPGGPYTFIDRTYSSSKTVYLDIPDPVYFVVRTVTPLDDYNEFTLTSVLSEEVKGKPSSNALGICDNEYNALVELYNRTNGTNWVNSNNWFTVNTPWEGVEIASGHVTSINLENNNLKGHIPASIGNLTNLQWLNLSNNQLSGSIPTEIGNLTNLRGLGISSNQLDGVIPSEIGNLTNLYSLYLNNNQLTGTIPSQLGNMTNIEIFNLSGNRLSGALPSEIGNLTNLEELHLSGNQLSGDIPSTITNLTYTNFFDLGYNALSSNDPSVVSFLSKKGADWQPTQTLPPTGVSVEVSGSKDVVVKWTPIPFSSGNGYYEVGYSSTPGGPYTFDPGYKTTNKLASSLDVNRLDLVHPTYYVVRTVSLPNNWNQSTLTSQLSQEVMLTPPPTNKLGTDGSTIVLENMVVTANFPDFFYVEKQNLSWGLRVSFNNHPTPGDRVNIVGTLHTNEDGERYVEAKEVVSVDEPPVPQASASSTQSIRPVYMPNKALGGGNLFYNNESTAGQRGVEDGKGVNNIGLLVKTTGKVDSTGNLGFYINDGSRNRILFVKTSGYNNIPYGSVVCVTGISSCTRCNDHFMSTILATNVDIISPAPDSAAIN